jgi:hypothetical protein
MLNDELMTNSEVQNSRRMPGYELFGSGIDSLSNIRQMQLILWPQRCAEGAKRWFFPVRFAHFFG